MNPGFIALAIAVVGPLLSYFIAVRKFSGRVKDTEATELWAESRSIREWSTDRVKELHEQVESLEHRLTELEAAKYKLAQENRVLTREVYQLRSRIQHLQEEKETTTRILAQAQKELERLRWEAENAPRRRHSDPPITESEGGSE